MAIKIAHIKTYPNAPNQIGDPKYHQRPIDTTTKNRPHMMMTKPPVRFTLLEYRPRATTIAPTKRPATGANMPMKKPMIPRHTPYVNTLLGSDISSSPAASYSLVLDDDPSEVVVSSDAIKTTASLGQQTG